MRTILAVAILMVAGVAFGQNCQLCAPGTTPTYYRVTFAGTSDASLNGRTFKLIFMGGNTWDSEWRPYPVTLAEFQTFDTSHGPWRPPLPDGRRITFYHAGMNPTTKVFAGFPGGGFVSANVAGIVGLAERTVDVVATAGERDGNGPFVIPLKIGGTATVRP